MELAYIFRLSRKFSGFESQSTDHISLYGQAVKTLPFHGKDESSILSRVTRRYNLLVVMFLGDWNSSLSLKLSGGG